MTATFNLDCERVCGMLMVGTRSVVKYRTSFQSITIIKAMAIEAYSLKPRPVGFGAMAIIFSRLVMVRGIGEGEESKVSWICACSRKQNYRMVEKSEVEYRRQKEDAVRRRRK